MNLNRSINKTWIDLILISLVWLGAVILVNPVGEFPLNDDWMYAKAVQGLLEQGVFSPISWTQMTLLSHALWGALFSAVFGFSFNILRLSTLVLSLAGLVGTYLLFKQVHSSRLAAWVGVLLVAFNPLYFSLSNSFMTDVPFYALAVWCIYFLVRSLQNFEWRILAIGTIILVAAVLNRQFALFIPCAYLAAALLQNGPWGKRLLRGSLPLLFSGLALWMFETTMKATGSLPGGYLIRQAKLMSLLSFNVFLQKLPESLLILAIYLGLFLLPFLLILPVEHPQAGRRSLLLRRLLGIGIVAGLLIHLLRVGRFMPLGYNVLIKNGIGPITLRDVHLLGLPHLAELSPAFWVMVTILGALGAGLLVVHLARAAESTIRDIHHITAGAQTRVAIFLFLGSAIYIFPQVFLGFFDRYLIVLLPLLGAGILATMSGIQLDWQPKVRNAFAALVLIGMLVFTLASTRDYLEWNRVRWVAINSLTAEQGIPPEKIDGGFEFNGWTIFDPRYKRTPEKSWWWVQADDYLISMGIVDGYQIIREYPYTRWLPPGLERILILKRIN